MKKKIRVLIVEDERATAEVCRRTLVSCGAEVETADNGLTAEERIGKNRYDLLLIDIRLPQVDGKELFYWLRRNHREMAGKVMFITGDTMRKETQDFLKEVNQPFLLKPFAPADLKVLTRKMIACSTRQKAK